MKMRTMLLVVAFCVCAVAASFADDPNVGTWKLNESKSKISAGAPQNNTVVYTAEGDSYKCVVDGVDGSGNPTHNEWTGKFDGNDYAVSGDPNADTRSLKKVGGNRYKLANKKAGKTVVTGTVEFSPDGNTRTLTMRSKNASGKDVTSVAVYDRQSSTAASNE